MQLPTIDFRSIRRHHGSQHGGFEELVCQLAVLDTELGTPFRHKGIGADAGLECYRVPVPAKPEEAVQFLHDLLLPLWRISPTPRMFERGLDIQHETRAVRHVRRVRAAGPQRHRMLRRVMAQEAGGVAVDQRAGGGSSGSSPSVRSLASSSSARRRCCSASRSAARARTRSASARSRSLSARSRSARQPASTKSA